MSFLVAQRSDPRGDLVLGHDMEAKVLVQRPIPRNVGEGRERERPEAVRDGPAFHLLDQTAPDASTLMGGRDAHLLDVSASVDHVHEDEPDGTACLINGDPGPAIVGILRKHLDRSRLVVRDIVQPVLSESLPRGRLDTPERRQIPSDGPADSYLVHSRRVLSFSGPLDLLAGKQSPLINPDKSFR